MSQTNTFVKKEKIRFQHIDYAGIVFYPRFFEMLNCLMEDWFEEALCLPFDVMHKTGGIPTVDLKVQFKRPARLGQTISKHLWVKELGSSSVLCGFRFAHENNDTILEGEVRLVNVALNESRTYMQSAPFSSEIKVKMEPYLVSVIS